MTPNSHGGLDMAPKPPALVTPRGTRGAPRFCLQAGPPSTAPTPQNGMWSFPSSPPSLGTPGTAAAPLGNPPAPWWGSAARASLRQGTLERGGQGGQAGFDGPAQGPGGRATARL